VQRGVAEVLSLRQYCFAPEAKAHKSKGAVGRALSQLREFYEIKSAMHAGIGIMTHT